mmetsp:Transcript_41851/g.110859  ORF Transcript_41851/g.110859 Transcript_41851/m.110859 type:complete len:251 (-) Transcript_41851:149-901(-)
MKSFILDFFPLTLKTECLGTAWRLASVGGPEHPVFCATSQVSRAPLAPFSRGSDSSFSRSIERVCLASVCPPTSEASVPNDLFPFPPSCERHSLCLPPLAVCAARRHPPASKLRWRHCQWLPQPPSTMILDGVRGVLTPRRPLGALPPLCPGISPCPGDLPRASLQPLPCSPIASADVRLVSRPSEGASDGRGDGVGDVRGDVRGDVPIFPCEDVPTRARPCPKDATQRHGLDQAEEASMILSLVCCTNT